MSLAPGLSLLRISNAVTTTVTATTTTTLLLLLPSTATRCLLLLPLSLSTSLSPSTTSSPPRSPSMFRLSSLRASGTPQLFLFRASRTRLCSLYMLLWCLTTACLTCTSPLSAKWLKSLSSLILRLKNHNNCSLADSKRNYALAFTNTHTHPYTSISL